MTTNGIQNNDCRTGEFTLNNTVTCFEISPYKTSRHERNEQNGHKYFFKTIKQVLPACDEIKQYTAVTLCGLSLWLTSWLLFENLSPGKCLFNMVGVVIAGYVFGHTLERYTSITPIVGMTLVGTIYRNFGPANFLEHPIADSIDYHLRRVYPVIILTKGPLAWSWKYIRHNPVRVFSLSTLPWIVECLSIAFTSHILLGYPWYWGLHLGSILASVSSAVIIPTTLSLSARGLGLKNQMAQLVINAGSLDTAFTEGVFGVINSAIFFPASFSYKIIKGCLAIFLGIAIGVLWGVISDYLPDHLDPYAPIIRSLHIFSGGLLLTYAGGYYGWGGTSGVAIMVCAGVAATRWERRGWPINNNPVSEIYKLVWRIFEPMLFTLSGYFLDVSTITLNEFALVVGCIMSALFLRLVTALLVSLANGLSVKEGLYIAVTWIPKAIVEAVLVRTATDSLWVNASTPQDRRIAEQHSNIIVIAILLTSTIGSALTTILGPILLAQETRVEPEELYRTQTLSAPPPSFTQNRPNNTPYSVHNVDI